MPLPARLHADRQQQFALARKSNRRALAGLAAGDFEKARNAEPAPLAGLLGLLGARREMRDIGAFQRALEQRRKIAAVVDRADRRPIGHAIERDQVAAAQFGPLDAAEPRRLVDQAFKTVIRLRPAGAAVGA